MNPIRDAQDGLIHFADLVRAKREEEGMDPDPDEEGMDPEPEPPSVATPPPLPLPVDHLGRPQVGQDIKLRITEAMKTIDPGKRGAVLVIAETGPDGKVEARAHFAAKVGDHWKVAAGAGWKIGEPRPAGWVAVEASW